MWNDAVALRDRGAKVWLCRSEISYLEQQLGTRVGCGNCNDTGALYLQHVELGPLDSPVPAGNGLAMVQDDGKWYGVRTKIYHCPVCHPMERL